MLLISLTPIQYIFALFIQIRQKLLIFSPTKDYEFNWYALHYYSQYQQVSRNGELCNRNHQPWLLPLVVSFGTTVLTSQVGHKRACKIIIFFPNRNRNSLKLLGEINYDWLFYVKFTCHTFSFIIYFWGNLLCKLRFSILHCLEAGFVPYLGDKWMVPDLFTRDACIVDNSHCYHTEVTTNSSIWCMVMIWQCKKPGHQKVWRWSDVSEIFQDQREMGSIELKYRVLAHFVSALSRALFQYKYCLSGYDDSHDKDKTDVRLSYLYHEDCYIGKRASLYRWVSARKT